MIPRMKCIYRGFPRATKYRSRFYLMVQVSRVGFAIYSMRYHILASCFFGPFGKAPNYFSTWRFISTDFHFVSPLGAFLMCKTKRRVVVQSVTRRLINASLLVSTGERLPYERERRSSAIFDRRVKRRKSRFTFIIGVLSSVIASGRIRNIVRFNRFRRVQYSGLPLLLFLFGRSPHVHGTSNDSIRTRRLASWLNGERRIAPISTSCLRGANLQISVLRSSSVEGRGLFTYLYRFLGVRHSIHVSFLRH